MNLRESSDESLPFITRNGGRQKRNKNDKTKKKKNPTHTEIIYNKTHKIVEDRHRGASAVPVGSLIVSAWKKK